MADVLAETLKKELMRIDPQKPPVTVVSALAYFDENPALEFMPVLMENELKAVFFSDCRKFILGCNNGTACHASIPGNLMRDIPYVDVADDRQAVMTGIKNALAHESSLALISGRRYLGLVPVKRLLSFVHAHKLKEAIMMSPLTGLPGNYSIELEFQRRVDAGEQFVYAYIDLNDFKAYNDKYGTAKGDEVLKYTAHMLAQNTIPHFLGHVGGDDYVLMLPMTWTEKMFADICAQFDREIPAFYSERHRAQGYIDSRDREGALCRFPIISMAISAKVILDKCSHSDVTISLASLKQFVKKQSKENGGSRYAYDRRQ